MNLTDDFKQKVLRKFRHFRPILDVRTELNFHRRIGFSVAVEDAVRVDRAVKIIFRFRIGSGKALGGGQESLIGCRRCNRTRIHQCDRCDLAVLNLRAFPVREVSRGVPDGKCIVGRRIARTEARSAESSLHDGSCLKKRGEDSVFHKLHINRHRSRINVQRETVVSDALSF